MGAALALCVAAGARPSAACSYSCAPSRTAQDAHVQADVAFVCFCASDSVRLRAKLRACVWSYVWPMRKTRIDGDVVMSIRGFEWVRIRLTGLAPRPPTGRSTSIWPPDAQELARRTCDVTGWYFFSATTPLPQPPLTLYRSIIGELTHLCVLTHRVG